MNAPRLARARVLHSQSRYQQAIGELSLHLTEMPDDVEAHCLKALCLGELEQYEEATEHAQQAVAAAPDASYPHYVFSVVMTGRNRLDAASSAIEEAVRLDPQVPVYFAHQSFIALKQRKWTAALAAAEQALAIDPEHEAASNLRSMALVKLNRTDQAAEQIETALRRDPDNAWTHANRGWAYLETREIDKALEHFREALRLDPSLEYARQGMIQALMARHLFYRLFLRYLLWMAKLPSQVQWGVIIGLFLVYNYSRKLADAAPALAPWVFVFQIAYILFAWFTWVAQPMFQLSLRFHRFGRYALSRDERIAANLFAVCVLTAIGLFAAALTIGPIDMILGSLYALTLVMPLSAVFRCDQGQPRLIMAGYTLLLVATASGAFMAVFSDAWWIAWGQQLSRIYMLGILASGFVANGLMQWTPKK